MSDNKAQAAALKDEGNKAFTTGNFSRAAELFGQAIALDPTNHVLYSNRSGAYAGLKDYQKALEDAERVVELNPSWPKGYSRKGAALWGLHRLKDAAAAYRAGLERDPSNASMKDELASVEQELQQESASPFNMFAKMFNEDVWGKIAANPALARFLGEPDFVAKVKDIIANPSAVQMHLGDKRVQQLLGALLGVQVQTADDPMDAEPTPAAAPAPAPAPKAAPAKAAAPSKPAAAAAPPAKKPEEMTAEERQQFEADQAKEKGNAAYKQRDFAAAMQHYEQALELTREKHLVYLNMSAVRFEEGQFEQCLELAQKALEEGRLAKADFKFKGRALTRCGNALTKLDRLEEAIRTYQQALVEDRNADTLQRKTAVEKLKKERDEQAYFSVEKSQEAKTLGNDAFREHKFPEAVQHYSEAIRRNPKDETLYSNRATAYSKLGALPEALRDCDTCLQLNDKFVKAYIRKGLVQMQLKEYHKALETFQLGLRVDPDNTELQEGLAKVLRAVDASQRSDTVDEEQVRHAMADPEIQALMSDPLMRKVLQDLNDPQLARSHMENPAIRQKVNKLIAAGIIRTR